MGCISSHLRHVACFGVDRQDEHVVNPATKRGLQLCSLLMYTSVLSKTQRGQYSK